MSSEVYSIAMAAGASSRMPPELRPKACCQVGTISVIEYALQTYEQAGIHKHAVVVGRGGEKVMETLSGKGYHVLFAYQTQPRGTGDAVRCAVEMLAGIDRPEYVLIAAGDKVIAPEVIRGLMERFAASGNDLCLVAGRSSDYPGAGRIVLREGHAQAIIEVPDIKVRQLAARLKSSPRNRTMTVGQLAALAEQYVSMKKLGTVFPALKRLTSGPPEKKVPWETIAAAAEEIPDAFDLPCGPVPVQEAFEATWSNLSVYAGRFAAISSAVEQLRADNVQREWYLTDIVKILASKGGAVGLFRVQNPEDCMAFNTVQELEEVRKVYALRSISAEKYPGVETWANCFAARNEKGLLAQAVEGLGRRIGSAKTCILVRSPGLINLMGRHIDHQGGLCNMMAIDRDIVLAAALRDDDRVNLWNASEREYPHRTFTFSELATDIVWEDWRRTLNTQFMQRYVSKAAGDWVNYVKGAALRLQHRFRDRKLRGMDAFVCGNIPAAGGLDSSSALVVATADALVEPQRAQCRRPGIRGPLRRRGMVRRAARQQRGPRGDQVQPSERGPLGVVLPVRDRRASSVPARLRADRLRLGRPLDQGGGRAGAFQFARRLFPHGAGDRQEEIPGVCAPDRAPSRYQRAPARYHAAGALRAPQGIAAAA